MMSKKKKKQVDLIRTQRYTFHNVIGKYRMRYIRCIDLQMCEDVVGRIGIGYSVCSILDRYDEKKVEQIAVGRARKDVETPHIYKSQSWNSILQKLRKNAGNFLMRDPLVEEFCEQVVRTIDKRLAKRYHTSLWAKKYKFNYVCSGQ